MKDWIKWGLVTVAVGAVIEYITMGYLQFFWLAPKLDRIVGSVLHGYIPGQTLFLISLLYFISGVLIWKIWKIVSKYALHRD